MLDDLPRLRALHGATAALWGGEAARAEPHRWVALSGARHLDFNVVVLHGASGGEAIPRTLEEIKACGAPSLVMVTGPALGEVQQLVDASWVCIGAMPLMGIDLEHAPAPDSEATVRRLTRDEVPHAQALVAEVFGYEPQIAAVALPEATADTHGRSIWGLFADDGTTLLSCAGTMVAEDVVAVWSMATSPAHRRQGHASRLLRGALAGSRADGARCCLLTSSAAGEPFYRALGFTELESWQQWSRPRWVFSRL